MSRAVRAEHAIAVLAQEEGLSIDGKLAVENAIDPFPDTRRPTRGWPDAGVSATITPRDKRSLSVSNNATGFTTNWDCYIFNMPIAWDSATNFSLFTTFLNGSNNTNVGYFSGSGTQPRASGLCVFTVPAGVPFSFSTWALSPATGYSFFGLETPPTYLTDSMRAISMGIEVHNTTAELTRSGSVVCFRQPMNSSRYASTMTLANSGATAVLGAISSVTIAAPPTTPSAALAFSDSTQWNAAKGCYLPCALQTMDLPYNANCFTVPRYYTTLPSDVQTAAPFITTAAGISYGGTRLWTEFAQSGAVFTGLSNSTTLTVNWNVIYEIQAAGQSTLLENIATPSPPLDLKAMRLLSMLHHLLPIAVEVDRNSLGDWIKSAAGTMAAVLKPSASMIQPMLAKMKHPMAQMAAAAIAHSSKEIPTKKLSNTKMTTNAAAAQSRQKVHKGDKGSSTTPMSGNAPGNTA